MALTDSLISYWTFDESTGNAIDAHGSHDGTVTGATQNISGKINTCYSFDGTNDKVVITDHADFDITDAITIAMWVKFDDITTDDWDTMLDKSNDAAEAYLMRKNKQKIQWNINRGGTGSGQTVWTGDVITATGTWYYIVATYDKDAGGTTEMKVYINGSESATADYSTAISTNARNIGIGRQDASGYGPTNGDIDEVAIWSRALTADEVTALYNSGDGLAYPLSQGTTYNETYTESFSTSDLKSLQPTKNIPESFNLTSGFSRRVDLEREYTDSFSLTDLKSFLMDKNIQNTLNLSDGDIANISRILTESMAVSGNVYKQIQKALILLEEIGLTNQQIMSLVFLFPGEEFNLTDLKSFLTNKNINETIGLSDEVLRQIQKALILSEEIGLTNQQIMSLVFLFPGESFDLTDLKSFLTNKNINESFSLSDLKSFLMNRNIDESFNLTDAKSFLINKNITEILNLSDGDFSNIIKILNESIGTSAEVLKQLSINRTFTEETTLSNQQLITLGLNFPGETINLTDSKTFQLNKSLTEVANLLDEYSRVWTMDREYSESLSLSDEVLKSMFRSLSESLSLLDELTTAWSLNRDFSETINLSDVRPIIELLKTLLESFNLVESYSRIWSVKRTFSELFEITDGDSKAFTRILTEAFGLSEEALKTIMRELIESYNFSDVLYADKWILRIFTESISTSDEYSKIWALAREYSELMNLNATVVKTTSKLLTNTFTLSESLTKSMTKIMSESQSLSDDLTKQTIKNLLEGINLSDGDIHKIIKELVEGLNLTDTKNLTISRILSEIANLSDDLTATRMVYKELLEALSLTDGETFNFIKLLTEDFNFSDFFLNIIFSSLRVASARADIQGIITAEGIQATLIRQTETTDSTGSVTAVSDASYAIYMSIQDILREDRQLRDMGSAFLGEAKIFLFHEYPDSITGNGAVSAQVGDMIKDDDLEYWRIETINGEREMDGSEIFKSAIIKRVDLDQ